MRYRLVLLSAFLLAGCDRGEEERAAGPARGASTEEAAARKRYGGPIHGPAARAPGEDGWDLRSLRLAILLDSEGGNLSVQSTLVLRPRPEGSGDRILCSLDDETRVESVVAGGASATFEHQGGVLAIERPSGEPGEDVEAIVFYSRRLPGALAGVLAPDLAWHPRRGTGDPFRAELSISAPGELQILSMGFEVDPRKSSGLFERRFLLDRPAAALGVAWGRVLSPPVERAGVRLRGLDTTSERLAEVGDLLDRFTAEFGPYPAATLVVAELPTGELAGAAGAGFLVLSPGRARPAAVAHLLAHGWWRGAEGGDEAVCHLAEALATGEPSAADPAVDRLVREARSGELSPVFSRYAQSDRSVEALKGAFEHLGG